VVVVQVVEEEGSLVVVEVKVRMGED